MSKKDRPKWFLREWREFRGVTLEDLAERVGSSSGYVSDLEKGKRRFNSDHLEQFALALNITPADLMIRDPLQPESIFSLWDLVPEAQRPQAVEVLRTFTRRTGTDG